MAAHGLSTADVREARQSVRAVADDLLERGGFDEVLQAIADPDPRETVRRGIRGTVRTFAAHRDEFRVLYAARRLRLQSTPRTRGSRLRQLVTDAVDLIVAVITVTLRRADEMGDAITARGGTGQISAAPSRPNQADWVALSIASAVCGAAVAAALLLGV